MQMTYQAIKNAIYKPLTAIVLLLPTITGKGQVKHKQNITDQIRSNIGTYLKLDKGFEHDSCINVISFIKFKIINGKIDSVAISKDSPRPVKEGLTDAVVLINKNWHLTKAEETAASNKIYLLPVIFYYEANCTPMIIEELPTQLKTDNKPDPNIPLKRNLINMLSFDAEPNISALECVLIKPIYFANLY